MKLNEIFTEWKTGGGIFSLMVNPPWKDSITGLELDIEYFTNQSGTKQPSLLLLNFIEDNKILQNDVLTISNLLLNRFGRNWTKLWNTLLLEYNPINNYDMEETENLVIDEIINNSGESSNSSEIDSNRYAFDSETPTPTEGQRQTNSNEFSDNGTRNNTHVRELKRSGNIGVTTSQQMITAERDLWVWDFFKTVFKDVDSVLTVPIFSLDYCKKTYEYVNGNESENEKYILPVATALSLGGIKADPKTESDTVPVHIDNNGFLFVPTYTEGGSEYILQVATALSLGGIKADPKTESDTVPVHIDNNGFLFVPTYTGGEILSNIVYFNGVVNNGDIIEDSKVQLVIDKITNNKYWEIIIVMDLSAVGAGVLYASLISFSYDSVNNFLGLVWFSLGEEKMKVISLTKQNDGWIVDSP